MTHSHRPHYTTNKNHSCAISFIANSSLAEQLASCCRKQLLQSAVASPSCQARQVCEDELGGLKMVAAVYEAHAETHECTYTQAQHQKCIDKNKLAPWQSDPTRWVQFVSKHKPGPLFTPWVKALTSGESNPFFISDDMIAMPIEANKSPTTCWAAFLQIEKEPVHIRKSLQICLLKCL